MVAAYNDFFETELRLDSSIQIRNVASKSSSYVLDKLCIYLKKSGETQKRGQWDRTT
jgi:hypothetical protein